MDAELKRIQENFAELEVKEEGEVENGDTAVIDFEGFKDGVHLRVARVKIIRWKSAPTASSQALKNRLSA